MNDYKSFLTSKGIWGGVIALLATLAPMVGLSFTAADGHEIMGLVNQGIALFGAALAIYGRIVAKDRIA